MTVHVCNTDSACIVDADTISNHKPEQCNQGDIASHTEPLELSEWAGNVIYGVGVRMCCDVAYRRTYIVFETDASARSSKLCGEFGFWWSPSKGMWVQKLTNKAKRDAVTLLPLLSGLCSRSRACKR